MWGVLFECAHLCWAQCESVSEGEHGNGQPSAERYWHQLRRVWEVRLTEEMLRICDKSVKMAGASSVGVSESQGAHHPPPYWNGDCPQAHRSSSSSSDSIVKHKWKQTKYALRRTRNQDMRAMGLGLRVCGRAGRSELVPLRVVRSKSGHFDVEGVGRTGKAESRSGLLVVR